MNYCPNCFGSNYNGQVCSDCKYDAAKDPQKNPMALPPGTEINDRYIIGRVLGSGGFGITYIAYDNLNQLICAVKEYVPKNYAERKDKMMIPLDDQKSRNIFNLGKESFSQEARILSLLPLDIRNVVRLFDDFEENNTVYYAMNMIDGVTIKQMMKNNPRGTIPLQVALEIIGNAGRTLDLVHKRVRMLHRDISPDNIMIRRQNGEAVLIDFGNSKSDVRIRDSEQERFAGLKHGYAAYEQYMGVNQGSWTDVYSLAATFYHCVSGQKLPRADERLSKNLHHSPLIDLVPGCTQVISDAVEAAIRIDYRNRTQTVEEFISNLNGITSPRMVTSDQRGSGGSTTIFVGDPPVDYTDLPLVNRLPYPVNGGSIYIVQRLQNNSLRRWQIPADQNVIVGKNSNETHIVVSDLPEVSRKHVSIKYDSLTDVMTICDLSINGTYVNNIRLKKNKSYFLNHGDVIALAGNSCILGVTVENE